jgi:hypothetical protein
VIANGVINLCVDTTPAFSEIVRVLRPGGQRWPTSTSGPPESLAGYPVRVGKSSSRISASKTSRSLPPSIRSAAPRGKETPGRTTCRVTPSSPRTCLIADEPLPACGPSGFARSPWSIA